MAEEGPLVLSPLVVSPLMVSLRVYSPLVLSPLMVSPLMVSPRVRPILEEVQVVFTDLECGILRQLLKQVFLILLPAGNLLEGHQHNLSLYPTLL